MSSKACSHESAFPRHRDGPNLPSVGPLNPPANLHFARRAGRRAHRTARHARLVRPDGDGRRAHDCTGSTGVEQAKPDPHGQPQARNVISLERLIAALRAEEAKYRDVDYSLRLTTRNVDPTTGKDRPEIQAQETRRVVLQGNLLWFRGESTTHLFDTVFQRDELAAYDGEHTRTVYAGNSATIHVGRFEHADIYPPHTIPLCHYRVNFPLSVYLSGADAIYAYPKLAQLPRAGVGL